MPYTIEIRHNPNITEAEINRRLASCYDLLLDLAGRSRDQSTKSDCESEELDSHLKASNSESA